MLASTPPTRIGSKWFNDREFRKDLYYRPNVFPIHLPRLRERKADRTKLVEYLVQQYSVSVGKTIEKPVADVCSSAS